MRCHFETLPWLTVGLFLAGITVCEASVTRYVSFSMPEAQLKRELKTAGQGQDEIVVFRGLPEPGGYPLFIRQLIPLIRDLPQGERPRISIDPKAFEQASISRVPVTQVGSEKDLRQARYPVMESDPRIRMREALSIISPTRWKEALLKDSVRSQPKSVGNAPSETPYTLEPVYRLPRTLKDADGSILANEGQRANALDGMPGPFSLLVVDATDDRQIRSVRDHQGDLQGTTLLMAGLHPGASPQAQASPKRDLEMPIYPAPERWLEQLRITGLPAEVRTQGSLLEVRPWQP